MGTPDATTGVVTGTLGFTEPAGRPLAYAVTSNPTQGSVTVSPTGAYTYTPTAAASTTAAQLVAGSATAVVDTFVVTATDGIAATNETVAVPVSSIAVVAVSGVTATSRVTTVRGSAGLVINLDWDSSVSSAPPSFKTAVVQAAQMIGADVSTTITLNIAVGYGEIDGSAIGSGSAEGETLGDQQESYTTVKQQLAACDTTAIGQAVVAYLPANNPFGTRTFDVAGAQLKALGVDPANSTALDGAIGFSTDWPTSDLVAAALHELTHTMGRNSGWGSASNGYDVTPLDLTRYSAPGVLVCDGTLATTAHLQYFSVDGGSTVLADYSTTSDYGDWATNGLTAADPFDAYVPSNSNSLTSVDLAVLDAIGYTTI